MLAFVPLVSGDPLLHASKSLLTIVSGLAVVLRVRRLNWGVPLLLPDVASCNAKALQCCQFHRVRGTVSNVTMFTVPFLRLSVPQRSILHCAMLQNSLL